MLQKLIIAMMLSVSLTGLCEVLPAPQTTGGKPLYDAMSARRSDREFDPSKPVTRQDLSNLLWAAWGITHEGKRTIATAMNRQELVIYVITPTEVSRYNPEANTLTVINRGDFRKLATRQDFAAVAPLNIVLAVDTDKQDMVDFQAYTAGAASHAIYLYCASVGLKTVVRAGFDREGLPGALKMPANEKVMFVQTVGW